MGYMVSRFGVIRSQIDVILVQGWWATVGECRDGGTGGMFHGRRAGSEKRVIHPRTGAALGGLCVRQ